MVPGLKVLLFFTLHLLQAVKGSMVHLNNNGYEGVVIAINPSVPEDERLIPSIKTAAMVTQASTYLFEATQGRVYFRNVSILVPMTWKSKSEYLMPKRESYDKADVIVADPYLKYGDDPYTLQYGQCGDRGRVFVHEWAHLRWGVFDEYNVDRPFYISKKNTIEATRCSVDITGTNAVRECQSGSCVTRRCRRPDSRTRLYEPKCIFIPDKIQTARASIMFMQNLSSVVEFCTEKTHNSEAPNLQNKMCNRRSTWDVIKESADFQNAPPMTGTEAPPPPTFSLLKSRQRVVCLVLDKSGSMNSAKCGHILFGSEDRLIRMNQAAELYLTQIVEKKSMVGLVTFDSTALIKNSLINITNGSDHQKITANLPQQASGGTSICSGLEAGFQTITSSGQSTSGSEIVLLTDGEDNGISSCFDTVERSGAVIHTIALGPSAARELETLSDMTGGLRFYASKDLNSLVDAFSRISSTSGSISQQALQLESRAFSTGAGAWITGTVPVDSTIGNDTFFVIAWTAQKPDITLRDPKGKKYTTSDFQDDTLNNRSARLQIPGTAEGADTVKNDGIYTRYFTDFHGNGRYSLKVRVQARKNKARLGLRQKSKSLYIPGYVENEPYGANPVVNAKAEGNIIICHRTHLKSKIILNPPRPEIPEEATEATVEDFSRLTSGGSFTVSGAPPDGDHAHVFPPSKVTDLEAEFTDDHIHLTWTAPGKVLDKGRAHRYTIRISERPLDLQEDLNSATLVNTSGLIPKEAGSKETFIFKPETFKIANGTQLYITIQADNDAGLTSEVSNIAQAVKFIPSEPSISALGPDISAICLTIWGLTVIFNYILN
ncbi:Calcium-activated chloride channel regulator 3A-1 [Apodemus speciosus]|uniref:Calcium-activated chloride channel regulator 3A-1 n=1 Tax=Apodemus speciosus TaxID=105296 RepID=A0ABQ0EMT4_APOSI